MTKICNKCKVEKLKIEFYKRHASEDGLQSICKVCDSVKRAVHYQNNKEATAAQQAAYREANREALSAQRAAYYVANKDTLTVKFAAYYKANQEAKAAYNKAYYQANREVLIVQQVAYERQRLDNDPVFRAVKNLRRRTNRAVEAAKTGKSYAAFQLVGCGPEELRTHLESQFTEGMSWSNYGKWHIDHIRPCASFDLTDKEQQKVCFHYTNLQPLWAKDNLKKGSKT